jgi:hypothetical protein
MFEQHLETTLIFFKTNPVVAGVIILFIAICFYSKPKESLKLVAFITFLIVAFYIITLLAGALGSGSSQKDQMIYKTDKAIRD